MLFADVSEPEIRRFQGRKLFLLPKAGVHSGTGSHRDKSREVFQGSAQGQSHRQDG